MRQRRRRAPDGHPDATAAVLPTLVPVGLRTYFPFDSSARNTVEVAASGTAVAAHLVADRHGTPRRAAEFDESAAVKLPPSMLNHLPRGSIAVLMRWDGSGGLHAVTSNQRDNENTWGVLSLSGFASTGGQPTPQPGSSAGSYITAHTITCRAARMSCEVPRDCSRVAGIMSWRSGTPRRCSYSSTAGATRWSPAITARSRTARRSMSSPASGTGCPTASRSRFLGRWTICGPTGERVDPCRCQRTRPLVNALGERPTSPRPEGDHRP
jgi:hypothetical protein